MLDFLTNHRKRRTQHAKPKPKHRYRLLGVFAVRAIVLGFSGIFAGVRDRELSEVFYNTACTITNNAYYWWCCNTAAASCALALRCGSQFERMVMDWLIAYWVVGFILAVSIGVESLSNKEKQPNLLSWFLLAAVFPFIYPYALYAVSDSNLHLYSDYRSARNKRDAQDFKLYGC